MGVPVSQIGELYKCYEWINNISIIKILHVICMWNLSEAIQMEMQIETYVQSIIDA